MKGRAYIAAYRFMREHDLKPYIYRTDDYGETWTLLTDGKNGIPIDHPTRVVREDPKQAGLLYAGTEFGVVRLVQRRQELAAAAAEPAGDAGHRHQGPPQRPRHLDDGPVGVDHGQRHAAAAAGGASPMARRRHRRTRRRRAGSMRRARQASTRRQLPGRSRCSSRAKRFASATHGTGVARRAGVSDDAARSSTSISQTRPAPTPSSKCSTRKGRRCTPGRAGAAQRRAVAPQAAAAAFRRGGGGSPGIRPEAGMQRITWDLRYPGPWAPNTPEGGFGGPMVPPGQVQRAPDLGRPDHHADVRREVGPAHRRRRRHRRRHRRAGEVPAAGARRDQRRAQAAAEHRAGDAEGRREARPRHRPPGRSPAQHQVRPPAARSSTRRW